MMHNRTVAITPRHRWVMRENVVPGPEEFLALRAKRLVDGASKQDLLKTASHAELLKHLPEPFLLKGVREAALRLVRAMEEGEPIVIFGDYDVDGTTSAAMFRRFFAELNHPVHVYIPERLVEGYGLNPTGVRNLAERFSREREAGIRVVVVTVDNGIAAVEACELARTLGMDVVITDHHDVPPSLPNAHCIVNPKQEGCTFPYRMLAGVGVAFYVMAGLRALLRERGHPLASRVNLRRSLDLVALGTIADLAPLDGVNHILCRVGLEVMFEHVVSGSRPGLAALLKLAGWNAEEGRIDASDVGFKIGPRLNAAGRLGNALATEELLSTNDALRAQDLAESLHLENSERQRIEKSITQQALAQVADLRGDLPAAFVLHNDEWHTGVVGIVASRVLEKYYRPTLVLGRHGDMAKGSGRSTHAFDLFSALNDVRSEFVAFGGHFHAVGLSIEHSKIRWLQQHLHTRAAESISQLDTLHPLEIDGATALAALNEPFLQALLALEPYGVRNPRPKWLIPKASIVHIKRVGKTPDSNHARVTFVEGSKETPLIAFGMADVLEDAARFAGNLQLVVEGRLQLFRGTWRPELRLIDFSPVDGGHS